jgi:RNA-directed DNA polymerase
VRKQADFDRVFLGETLDEPLQEGKQMTVQNTRTGALSGNTQHWHSISWSQCHREVRRLQARIVKATKEGRWNKVKSLQWLLTHSFSGKALAVRRVTENQGKKTPGVDKVRWSTPEAKYRAIKTLNRHGYRPQPLRRIYIPKSNGRRRPLGIPTMKDRAMQALYLLALEPVSETKADPHSYGFRPARSTADAIEQCFTLLARQNRPQWVLEGDIRGCFDEIAHSWLIAHVPMDKVVLRRWLQAGYIDNRQLFPTEAGTPQGGIISPALANWALDGLQHLLAKSFKQTRRINGRKEHQLLHLVRYADDFVITGKTKELLDEVKVKVASFLHERGLTLSADKTRITHISEGFDFLGQNIRTYDNKVLIKPAKKNVKSFLDKVRATIKENKTAKQQSLIRLLNPILIGWANYHRHVVSKRTYAKLDHEIWLAIWKWCCRRHSSKSKNWIMQRYFRRMGNRKWTFIADSGEQFPDGEPKWDLLFSVSDTAIRRHTKIQSEANAFDPVWESYFEERTGLKMLHTITGRKKLIRLWFDQQGYCPMCDQRITKESGWHVHHIIRRVDGGRSTMANLILVHPNCHSQIHSLGLTVMKPVPAQGLRKA